MSDISDKFEIEESEIKSSKSPFLNTTKWLMAAYIALKLVSSCTLNDWEDSMYRDDLGKDTLIVNQDTIAVFFKESKIFNYNDQRNTLELYGPKAIFDPMGEPFAIIHDFLPSGYEINPPVIGDHKEDIYIKISKGREIRYKKDEIIDEKTYLPPEYIIYDDSLSVKRSNEILKEVTPIYQRIRNLFR
jgi:hypothetical protein